MQTPKSNARLSEIDFLRGLAILLVLFSHQWIADPLQKMGWIGVDLFFVLSGFLVSGLLFNEHRKFGSIEAKRFLIRRGFKIYPAFYFSIALTVILLAAAPGWSFFPDPHTLTLNVKGIAVGLVIECLFVQSYFFGFWGHHWSLAVEEHFYLLLTLLLVILSRRGLLEKRKLFFQIAGFVFAGCLVARLVTNIYSGETTTYTATHLRLDSLFAGVLVSYIYHYEPERLGGFYFKYRRYLLLSIPALLSFTPFTDVLNSYFVKTIGFTMLWLAFSFLLLCFLFEPNIKKTVSRLVSPWVYRGVASIGVYSYGIYLFHMYVVRYIVGEVHSKQKLDSGEWSYGQLVLSFALYWLLSIFIGISLSKLIEIPMLRVRDRWFPRRSPAPMAING